jgi:hypothetical protein
MPGAEIACHRGLNYPRPRVSISAKTSLVTFFLGKKVTAKCSVYFLFGRESNKENYPELKPATNWLCCPFLCAPKKWTKESVSETATLHALKDLPLMR